MLTASSNTMAFASYRSILLRGVKSQLNPYAAEWKPSHIATPIQNITYWNTPETVQEEFCTYNNEKLENPAYEHYTALLRLRTNPIFRKKFAVFAENMLCITNTDTEKGLRLALPWWNIKNYKQRGGQKKKYVGLYLEYKQDDFIWQIAYECDDIDDPTTGWFMQWFHREECCGFSCDYYGCHTNYKIPKTYMKNPTKRQTYIRKLIDQ